MRLTRLIVNADDFGLSRGISDGIFAAHTCGIVTSASLMANQPASDYAITLRERMPGLGVGVHLNLCAGKPVMPARDIPTLVDRAGNFLPPAVLFRKLWRFQVADTEIQAEFQAQIRWLKGRGIAPTHADSHLHVHLYPAALRPFIHAARAEGIRCVRAPRCTVWPAAGPAGGPHEGQLARRLAVSAYRSSLQLMALREFTMPHSRVSFRSTDRRDRKAIGRSWLTALDHLPPGTFELACHPGMAELGFSETDRIATQREEELRWLMCREIREAIERNSVQLVRYGELQDVGHERAARVEVNVA
jgi:chitin disaccharide deacetylase